MAELVATPEAEVSAPCTLLVRAGRGEIRYEYDTGTGPVPYRYRKTSRPKSFIALAGVAAETGIVMLIYLNQALDEIKARRKVEGRALTRGDLYDAIMEGAVERVCPKMMTVMAIMVGLLPIMWSTGTGSEIMQRIAVPMIGGMISSTLLTLIVIPAIFGLVKGFRLPSGDRFDVGTPVPSASVSIERPSKVLQPVE
jgi:copper/silver efflux system protein